MSKTILNKEKEIDDLQLTLAAKDEEQLMENLKNTGIKMAKQANVILKNINSLETELSCISCFKPFDDPCVIKGCGHHFCKSCIIEMNSQLTGCLECNHGSGSKIEFKSSEIIERLLGKYEFIHQSTNDFTFELEALEKILNSVN
ncbi:hypothetical protein GEMRC1_011039 [Eukaryota sp. GEM-RC1]